MKKLGILYAGLSLLAGASVMSLTTSCTDDFEETNTNPNKVYDVDINDIFAGTVKRTMDNWAEMNYRRFLNFSRLTVVLFCSNPGEDRGDGYFRNYYVNILRDLIKLERKYMEHDENAENPDVQKAYQNRLAVVRIWKSYVFYTMASCWGPLPYSDAITYGTENKRYYKYDSEKEVYAGILSDLKKAIDNIDNADANVTSDILSADPLYGADGIGQADMTKWRKFANTLRLNVAMHIQNLDPDLSREAALEALADGDFIAANSDNAVLQWGLDAENSSSYYYRSILKNRQPSDFGGPVRPALNEYGYIYYATFKDPRLPMLVKKSNADVPKGQKANSFQVTDTITRPHVCSRTDKKGLAVKCKDYTSHQRDGQNAFRYDSITVHYTVDYVPYNEHCSLPQGYRWALVPGMTYTYNDPLGVARKSDYNNSYCADYFWNEQAHWVILTYADACFLRAEAAMLYQGDQSAAKAAYEEGIRASMDQWGVTDYADFMNQDGVKWGTTNKNGYHDRRLFTQAVINGANGTDGLLEQIYKQRQFADFFNGLEIWNVERRTRAFNWPPFMAEGGSSEVEGASQTYNFWTERLIYPEAEANKNGEANAEGIRMLREVSPFTRDERWGDNVFTSLGFAKRNPQIDNAEELWGFREIRPRMDYYEHTYGATWDECVANIKAKTGIDKDNAALREVEFEFASQLSVYIKFPWE